MPNDGQRCSSNLHVLLHEVLELTARHTLDYLRLGPSRGLMQDLGGLNSSDERAGQSDIRRDASTELLCSLPELLDPPVGQWTLRIVRPSGCVPLLRFSMPDQE